MEGAVDAARGSLASACTVRAKSITAIAANAADETPATSSIFSGGFAFMLLENRRITICLFY
jgi:hypothetical protein